MVTFLLEAYMGGAMFKAIIGLDLGGTNIKSVVMSLDGKKILHRRQICTEANLGVQHVIKNMARLICETSEIAEKEGYAVSAIGVGSAGLVENGVVRNSPNLPGWQSEVPLIDLLRNELPRKHPPILIENDVNCFIYGEYAAGAAKGYQDAVGLAIGTGVGGGIIVGGELYTGAHGGAGELGHMTVKYDGPLCKCGNKGCLEAMIGTDAIIKRYRRLHKSSEDLTVENISHLAKRNDPAAIKTLSQTGKILGVGLASIANIFNPQVIVLGGGVAQAGVFLIGPAKEEMLKRAMPYNASGLKIKTARLGPLAGAIGAALLAANYKDTRKL
jgi:glucokinase